MPRTATSIVLEMTPNAIPSAPSTSCAANPTPMNGSSAERSNAAKFTIASRRSTWGVDMVGKRGEQESRTLDEAKLSRARKPESADHHFRALPSETCRQRAARAGHRDQHVVARAVPAE